MEIIIPILLLAGIAVICAVLLTLSSIFFGVKENEKVTQVRDCLPGANCGACGYSGCDGYAKALGEGATQVTNLCIPGGDKVSLAIADILGVRAEDVVEKVAYVACNGRCGTTQKKYDYEGPQSCAAVNLAFNGDKSCGWACLGYGDCVKVCPQNAITIDGGVASIDPRKCIGCGICARQCPKDIIKLIPDTVKVVVECSNHEKGAITRKQCTNGCIGCMKCQKTCQRGAIKVENNLAVIDQTLCTGCGECAKVCPVGCIHEGNFICGARF